MTKYSVTIGDYNDVFSREEIEFKDWEEAEKYAYDQFNPEYKDKIEDLGSIGISLGIFYPVSDDKGNEIYPSDPRYDELSEQQEPTLALYVDIEEIEND